MFKSKDHAARHRGLLLVLLAACLGIVAVTLTQCRFVGDNVTGVELRRAQGATGGDACIEECREEFREARREENRRHRQAIRACEGDTTCEKEEEAKHLAILEQLRLERRECKRDCYDEGAGTAGR